MTTHVTPTAKIDTKSLFRLFDRHALLEAPSLDLDSQSARTAKATQLTFNEEGSASLQCQNDVLGEPLCFKRSALFEEEADLLQESRHFKLYTRLIIVLAVEPDMGDFYDPFC